MASLKKQVKMLKILVAVLAVVVIALAIYALYPSINLAVNGQPFGKRLTGINQQLSSSQLATINNASNSYFEIAGEKLLNLSLPGENVSGTTYTAPLFEANLAPPVETNSLIINGKPSVIYIGAISCIYCGESRWAMALALSRFGSFNRLYEGYSSIGDSDVPTLYWHTQNYTTKGGVQFGNFYQSNYINFFSAEYDSPITSGFQFPASADPISFFTANATNSSYETAMEFMNKSNDFQGTPFTYWGTSINRGATGVVFGNATSSSQGTGATNVLPLTYMSHDQIFSQLSQFNSTFAYEQFAAADIYAAEVCPAINNTASVCTLPAIKAIESKMGLA